MRTLLQDLHYALRQLRNAPAFALTAILTLALGIGINAAMFSVVDQVLLRGMPFPHAEDVVQMAVRTESGGFGPTSLLDIQDWQARSHSFEQIAYYTEQVPTLGGTSTPRLVPQIVSSSNLFDLLQARPMMGRTFVPDDSKSGHNNVVILGASIWQGVYHADPQIVGRSIAVNGIPYTVIGVMPNGFAFPANTGENSIWTPIPLGEKSMQDRSSAMLSVIGRLRPGVTVAAATHEMNSIHQQLVHQYPKDEDVNPIHMERYANVVTDTARPAIIALDIAVFVVWLISCANVAGLLLARGNNRRREVALRTALGARPSRLIRQFLTESLLLGLAGGALGLELADLTLRLLKHYLANAVIFGDQIHIDLKVCAFLFVASCLSAVLFGLLPALHATRVPPQDGLRQGTAASGISPQQTRWGNALVVGEIALTLTLLVAAGLMVRTLISLRHTRVGFVPDQVVTGEIYLPHNSGLFTGSEQQANASTLIQTFYTPLLDRIKALPGIQSAGLTTIRPLEGNWDFNMSVELTNHPKPQRSAQAYAQARATSSDYFTAMGIRLLQGRFFATTDSAAAPPAAIVNQAFVRRFLPNQNPIGQQLRYNDTGERQWSTIVGVIDDSPQKTLGQPPLPEIDYNLVQLLPQDELYPILGSFLMNVSIRSPLASDTIDRELRRAIHDLQPDAALNNVQTMQEVVDNSLGNQVLAARLLSLFALTGLLIAVAGIYGLLAYSVSQRTRELGVRLALGAQREAILWLVLRHALILLGIGGALGVIVSIASGKLLTSFLAYKLSGFDALVAISVAILLALCGLLASYLPARRAANIDPVVALRTE
ncbi:MULTISPECIES: ABC transporter permease [Acidobacteriaceae]|uniref:ABC transporter permease n=1 Tax=Acidobacteriaceae TaxID=204434 RepID=UPI00131BCB7C|nr:MULTISPECIES: ABC transporter permease [Acidobacteriaceae]MDW5264692.1 ABC transporter permease [Edaphobacter sp.]